MDIYFPGWLSALLLLYQTSDNRYKNKSALELVNFARHIVVRFFYCRLPVHVTTGKRDFYPGHSVSPSRLFSSVLYPYPIANAQVSIFQNHIRDSGCAVCLFWFEINKGLQSRN